MSNPEYAPATAAPTGAETEKAPLSPEGGAPQGNGHVEGPGTQGEKPAMAPLDTSAQQQPAANGGTHTAPTSAQPIGGASKDPKQIKQDLKNEQAYAKVLDAKSKGEGQELKSAIKEGQSATKTEQKAGKQESKAKKALDKALQKEYKLNKKLVEAKAKYDAAVVALEQAKAKMELKQGHHETTTALRDEKLQSIDELKRRSMAPMSPTSATA